MTRSEVRAQIEEICLLPAIRVNAADQAQYALQALFHAQIPIAEVTMTVPQGVEVIAAASRSLPSMIVGAGTVLDVELAKRCVDAGAKFLTSPGFVPEVVEFAHKQGVVVFPGAATPTEVITAWKAGADFVKIFPCSHLGGPAYIRTLKIPLPQIPLIASGGVNDQTAANFILAGASALGVGGDLIPRDALQQRQEHRILELARRLKKRVQEARDLKAGN